MVTLEVKQEVNFKDFCDNDVDLHHVRRRQESVRPSRRALAFRQHAGIAPFAEVRQLVADLRPRPRGAVGGRRRTRCVGPVGRDADAGEVDEREIDALSGGDGQPPRAVGGTTAALRRDAA